MRATKSYDLKAAAAALTSPGSQSTAEDRVALFYLYLLKRRGTWPGDKVFSAIQNPQTRNRELRSLCEASGDLREVRGETAEFQVHVFVNMMRAMEADPQFKEIYTKQRKVGFVELMTDRQKFAKRVFERAVHYVNALLTEAGSTKLLEPSEAIDTDILTAISDADPMVHAVVEIWRCVYLVNGHIETRQPTLKAEIDMVRELNHNRVNLSRLETPTTNPLSADELKRLSNGISAMFEWISRWHVFRSTKALGATDDENPWYELVRDYSDYIEYGKLETGCMDMARRVVSFFTKHDLVTSPADVNVRNLPSTGNMDMPAAPWNLRSARYWGTMLILLPCIAQTMADGIDRTARLKTLLEKVEKSGATTLFHVLYRMQHYRYAQAGRKEFVDGLEETFRNVIRPHMHRLHIFTTTYRRKLSERIPKIQKHDATVTAESIASVHSTLCMYLPHELSSHWAYTKRTIRKCCWDARFGRLRADGPLMRAINIYMTDTPSPPVLADSAETCAYCQRKAWDSSVVQAASVALDAQYSSPYTDLNSNILGALVDFITADDEVRIKVTRLSSDGSTLTGNDISGVAIAAAAMRGESIDVGTKSFCNGNYGMSVSRGVMPHLVHVIAPDAKPTFMPGWLRTHMHPFHRHLDDAQARCPRLTAQLADVMDSGHGVMKTAPVSVSGYEFQCWFKTYVAIAAGNSEIESVTVSFRTVSSNASAHARGVAEATLRRCRRVFDSMYVMGDTMTVRLIHDSRTRDVTVSFDDGASGDSNPIGAKVTVNFKNDTVSVEVMDFLGLGHYLGLLLRELVVAHVERE